MPTTDLAGDRLATLVSGRVDVDAAHLRFSQSSAGKFNTTFFIEGGPRPLVLRIAPPDDPSRMLFYEFRMMRQEPPIHARVGAQTTVPLPAILAHDWTHRHIDRDYLLMERLPGTPLAHLARLSPRAFGAVLGEVGWCLHQVHRITGDLYGYVGAHQPMVPHKDWPSAFATMWTKLLDDIQGCGGYSAEEGDFLRRLLDDHFKVFDRPVAASLLHMDVWAENILADHQGKLTGLVDWDRALWGDPEIEFAVLDYCGISEPPFWEGYGAERDRSPEAEIRCVFYLLYELQKYIFIERVRGQDPQEADRYRRQSLHLARRLTPPGA